jgi:hypothetical protein
MTFTIFAMHFCTNTSTDDPYLVIILHGMEFDDMALLMLYNCWAFISDYLVQEMQIGGNN